MKKVILFTGTPGTGKTKIANEVSLLLKKKVISTTKEAKKANLMQEFDENKQTYLVDVDKLVDHLTKLIKESEEELIIEGHLAHFLPAKYVKLCIVCTTELQSLKKRLLERNYSESKIRDNLDSEIFETCLIEAMQENHNIEKIDTTKDIKKTLVQIKKLLKKHQIL